MRACVCAALVALLLPLTANEGPASAAAAVDAAAAAYVPE